MDSFLKEELKKTKTVAFYDKSGKEVDKTNLDNQELLIIKKKDYESKKQDLLLFTFEDYLIKPFPDFDFHKRFNKGINIPLKVMQGTIIKQVGKMYYIKVKGFYFKSNYCVHCLKKENSNPVCNDCFKQLTINDIEEVTWEGYVPIKSIKEMTSI